MIILGINDSHDASAVLFKNGKILGYIQEERLSRLKSKGGFPYKSIDYLLSFFSIKKNEIDKVAVANKNLPFTNAWNLYPELSVNDHKKIQDKYWYPYLYENKKPILKNIIRNFKPKAQQYYNMSKVPFKFSIESNKKEINNFQKYREDEILNFLNINNSKLDFFDHHNCHAYYAYFLNKDHFKQNVNIVTADGGGDKFNNTVFNFNDEIVELSRSNKNRIGRIYESTTLLMNMHPMFHPFKIMGMAPYAKENHKKKAREIFENSMDVKGLDFNFLYKDEYHSFKNLISDIRFDGIAGAVQDFTENTLTEWFSNIYKMTKVKNFAFCGGVANNIKANKNIIEQKFVDSFYVPPGPGDENLALGAAYNSIVKHQGFSKSKKIIKGETHAYWGVTKNKKNKKFENFLSKNFYEFEDKNLHKTAKAIYNGDVVLFFNENMEFGSRALGNRSILSHPNDLLALNKLNSLIKKRDFWMPFAPAIINEDKKKYLKLKKRTNLNYMTIGVDVTKIAQKELYATLHQGDFTCRPLVVEKKVNPKLYNLIKQFKKLSSIGAVLNTSLNIHDKPIVFYPENLKEIIDKTNNYIKYIYLNGKLLKKK